MGNFKRYDGYVMHIPQEFIDSKLPVCPFCKSNNPHWLLDSKMEMSLAGSRTYYQCERCQAIISSTAADAGAEKGKSFAINPAMAALNAAQKGTKHQEVGVAYMRVDTLGTVCTDTSLMGKEFPITYFQEMAACVPGVTAVPQAAPAKFCTTCGAQLSGNGAFCSNCGAKQGAPVAASAATELLQEEPATQLLQEEPAAEPVVAPAEPVVMVPPVQPVVAPVQPVVTPVQPVAAPVQQAEPAAWKFPLVSVILAGVSALWAFIMMCAGFSFLEFMNVGCFAAIIVGMIICKQEKNLITAIGFLAMAFFGFIGNFISFVNYINWDAGGAAFFTLMFGSVCWLCDAGIGLTYLLGKEKLATLKTLGCALAIGFGFLMMIVNLVAGRGHGAVYQIFGFLFGTVPLYLGMILYTPFKK